MNCSGSHTFLKNLPPNFPFFVCVLIFFSVILIRFVISDCWSSPSVTNLAIWKDLLVASPTQRFCFLCVGSARTADRTCIHPSKLIFRLDVQQAVTHWQRRSQLPLSPFMQAKHHVSASTHLALQKDFVDKAVSVSEIFEHSEYIFRPFFSECRTVFSYELLLLFVNLATGFSIESFLGFFQIAISQWTSFISNQLTCFKPDLQPASPFSRIIPL